MCLMGVRAYVWVHWVGGLRCQCVHTKVRKAEVYAIAHGLGRKVLVRRLVARDGRRRWPLHCIKECACT